MSNSFYAGIYFTRVPVRDRKKGKEKKRNEGEKKERGKKAKRHGAGDTDRPVSGMDNASLEHCRCTISHN